MDLYRQQNILQSDFNFIITIPIPTNLRNIYEFKLIENTSGDTIRIYSVHLKASTGSTNEQQRLAEVNVLRSVTDALFLGSFYLVVGDFNIYEYQNDIIIRHFHSTFN